MKTRDHNFTRKKIDFILDSYFKGELDRRTDRKVQEWLLDDHNRSEKDKGLKAIWDEWVSETVPDGETVASLGDIRRRLAFPEKTSEFRTAPLLRRRLYRIAVAASVVVCVSAGTLWLTAPHRSVQREDAPVAIVEQIPEVRMNSMSAGERAVVQVDLPDGSSVWIHRHGSMTWPENFTDDRKVNIEGEAFFAVAKQEGRPFVVEGDGVSVKVLGTEFLVKTRSADTEGMVEVASGSVEVTVSGETHLMETRERLVYSDQMKDVLLSRLLPGEEVASWKAMDLVFDGHTLGEALNRIANFYNVTLSVDNALPVDGRVTVRFTPDESLEDVLFILSHVNRGFGYTIENNNVTINKL
jgi:ferric-dicitrate binding protein FerR (iron transport regulator)